MSIPSKSSKPNIASVSPGPRGGLAYPRAVTDDVRIRDIHEVAPPSHLLREFPPTPKAENRVPAHKNSRRENKLSLCPRNSARGGLSDDNSLTESSIAACSPSLTRIDPFESI